MKNSHASTKFQGKKPRILLTSVFGPFATDDEYGSRKINPMELFHNQVTRMQGAFSLRMFHPSFGLKMIQENINVPCTVLDFPKLERFIDEITNNDYDIIGISSIIPNVGKVKKMCELIRKSLPKANIVVGGHVANLPDVKNRIDADYIVKGEGIRWFREFLGEDLTAPVKHPAVISAFGARILGHSLPEKQGDVAAILIPSVGCPMGCNFCATSHLFGGKGKFINFYETGDELYSVICDLEKKLNVRSFFVLDENFLLNKQRALRLLELMILNKKSWSFNVFSSAKVVKSYTDEELVRLGISWIWMGLEGRDSQYVKLDGVDSKSLVKHLQTLGIRVLGSTIIGLENHTPDNIDEAIAWAVDHNTVFHQFMLYTALPGTPLYEEQKSKGTLLSEDECHIADTHGQYKFNFRHPHIKDQKETEYLINAFVRDFDTNGPSLLRLVAAMLSGWKKLKNHPDPCVRDRVGWEFKPITESYCGAIWAMTKWFRKNKNTREKAKTILSELYKEFGLKTKIMSYLYGPVLIIKMLLEERKLNKGWTYEPKTKYEKNAEAIALESKAYDSKKIQKKDSMEAPALSPLIEPSDA